jgi:hypothetical protein
MRKDIALMNVSSSEILLGLKALCRKERKLQSDFLAYLNAVEDRKLFAGEGYSSLFSYVTEHLGYSESSALKRIHVARLCFKYPELYYLIADGEVTLTSLQKVAPHIKKENAERLIKSICHKSVREVECLLAGEFPKPLMPDSMKPLNEEAFLIQFSADKDFMDKLNQAKALLGRKYPSGRLSQILGEALQLLLESEGKKKCMPPLTEQIPIDPDLKKAIEHQELLKDLMGDPMRKNTPRYIPRGIRREVWRRDEGRCQFPRPDGGICGETRFLEYDHVISWSLGGSSQALSNIRILCRTHNQWRVRQEFKNFTLPSLQNRHK